MNHKQQTTAAVASAAVGGFAFEAHIFALAALAAGALYVFGRLRGAGDRDN